MRKSQFSRAELVALSRAHDTASEDTSAASAALLAQFAETTRLDTANATTETDTLGRRRIVVANGERWVFTPGHHPEWTHVAARDHTLGIEVEHGLAMLWSLETSHTQYMGARELEYFIAKCQSILVQLRTCPGYVE